MSVTLFGHGRAGWTYTVLALRGRYVRALGSLVWILFSILLSHLEFGSDVTSCHGAHNYVMRSSKLSLKSKNMIFWHFLLGYWLGFNLMKSPQRLGNWFQRYKELKDWTNNNKQKKLSALFGCTLKTVLASSDSFCLITSHICKLTLIYLAHIEDVPCQSGVNHIFEG